MRLPVFASMFLMLLSLMSFSSDECGYIGNGKYKMHFKTKGFEDCVLIISDNQFIKMFKDGSSKTGKLERRGDCILILVEVPDAKKGLLEQKIEEGLGKECIEVLKRRGRTTYFQTSRTANLNIFINGGKLIRISK
jgi:hypothetical protein